LGKKIGVSCTLPTTYGDFDMHDTCDQNLQLISFGDIHTFNDIIPLVRVHSSCMASEIFGSLDCDCADQLKYSMKLLSKKYGLIIYLSNQEGRGHGLSKKIRAVNLMQTKKIDTAEAYDAMGLNQDIRDYQQAVDFLKILGIDKIRLITNNPRKVNYINSKGIEVVERIPTKTIIREENRDYLRSKNEKLNHLILLHDG